MALYFGCPVWGDKSWVGTFFPSGTKQKDFLSLYSQRLNTVEGNTTFYAIPNRETITRWRDETPPGFRFCFKFPQVISHKKQLRDCTAETQTWLDLLRLLGERAGPAFLQLPPRFAPDQLVLLGEYLNNLPEDIRVAVEVRHAGWYTPETEPELDRLLSDLGIGRVLVDVRGLRTAEPEDASTAEAQERKPHVPVRTIRTAPFTIIRYIAHPDLAENELLLDEWATTIAGWFNMDAEQLPDVYMFLHHPNNYYAPSLCRMFYDRISQHIALPELPQWNEPDVQVQQIRLF